MNQEFIALAKSLTTARIAVSVPLKSITRSSVLMILFEDSEVSILMASASLDNHLHHVEGSEFAVAHHAVTHKSILQVLLMCI